jgi:hypothetical protein
MYIFTGKNVHLIIVSFIVYIFVNMFENMIHYNIGRMNKDEKADFELPSGPEFLTIFIVMIIFAGIQGFLTLFFNRLK